MEQKTIHNVLSLYDSSEFVQKLIANFKDNPHQKLNIKGYLGSGLSLLTAQLYQRLPRPIFLLLDDKEEAAYYLNDLESLFSKEEVLFFPSSYRRPYEIEEVQNANVDDLNAVVKQYGPVDVYNFEKMTPLEDGDKTVYEAVYKVSFKGAEGTETFKVRKIDKLDGIVVGYASDVKPIVAQSDSLALKKDSVK